MLKHSQEKWMIASRGISFIFVPCLSVFLSLFREVVGVDYWCWLLVICCYCFGVDYCWCWSLAFAMIAVVNWRLLLLVLITRVSDRCCWWWLLLFGGYIYRFYFLLWSPRGLPSSYRKRVIPPYRIPQLHWSYILDWEFSLIKFLTAVLLSIHYVDSKQKIQI